MSYKNTQVSMNVLGRKTTDSEDDSPRQLLADRTVPCGCNTYRHEFRGTCDRKTDPASSTVTNVILPAPDPPPLALRTVPAVLPCNVIHCFVGAVVNSSRKSVSNTSSQRSLPCKRVNGHPILLTVEGNLRCSCTSYLPTSNISPPFTT